MANQLCIHCSQNPPCLYQDGIYCKTTPCMRDNPNANPYSGNNGNNDFLKTFSGNNGNNDFLKTFGEMFGGGGLGGNGFGGWKK